MKAWEKHFFILVTFFSISLLGMEATKQADESFSAVLEVVQNRANASTEA